MTIGEPRLHVEDRDRTDWSITEERQQVLLQHVVVQERGRLAEISSRPKAVVAYRPASGTYADRRRRENGGRVSTEETLAEPFVVGGRLAAWVLRADVEPAITTFVTGDDAELQLGLVCRAAGEQIEPHRHPPVERHLRSTCEALLVRRGSCDIDLYDSDGKLATSVTLARGDVVLLLEGAHGLRMHEDTVLVEVKQGPFVPPGKEFLSR
jgi:hypothetical protein